MTFNLSKSQTTSVELFIAVVKGLKRDHLSNIIITLAPLDHETGKELLGNEVNFTINTIGLNNGSNYSVGEAFGAVLDFYQDEKENFDLEELIETEVICFVHHKTPKNGNVTYYNPVDIFPLATLQFPWIVEKGDG
ncbi:hypothetical protein JZO77_13460 [Enterococcus hulanensis]|uniref:hypothetical protein n=1 Tax=Enterococcus hulanensis TaxID=2559929 RepID=UPI001A8E35EF|nr:hypothetical protein [Enterococcus hulanensis]MBO0457742.1 hypothetical protein [Enterococcus hulanensis]